MFGAIEAGGTKIVCATATAPDPIIFLHKNHTAQSAISAIGAE